jgi:hypothetical protein
MTYSQRKKDLQKQKGPSSKTLRKREEKLLRERQERLKARVIDTPKKPIKVHRNDLCSCNSGKKFKQCCFWGPEAALSIEKFLNKLGDPVDNNTGASPIDYKNLLIGESKYAKPTS